MGKSEIQATVSGFLGIQTAGYLGPVGPVNVAVALARVKSKRRDARVPRLHSFAIDCREILIILRGEMNDHTPATFLGGLIGRVRAWPGFLWRLEGSMKGAEFQGRYEILGRPIVSVARGGRLVFGDNVKIYSATRANPLGCFQPCVLRALLPGSQVILGPRVGLSGTVICAASSIEAGEGTIFGSGAMIIDNDFHFAAGDWDWTDDPKLCAANARPITIGRGVFVGARAIILKGVKVGDRAVIGAGAVVTKDVPARHLAVGNPAKITPLEG